MNMHYALRPYQPEDGPCEFVSIRVTAESASEVRRMIGEVESIESFSVVDRCFFETNYIKFPEFEKEADGWKITFEEKERRDEVENRITSGDWVEITEMEFKRSKEAPMLLIGLETAIVTQLPESMSKDIQVSMHERHTGWEYWFKIPPYVLSKISEM